MSLASSTVSSTAPSACRSRSARIAWARAASKQSSTHSLAELWMTPPPRLPGERERNWAGSPTMPPSQSSTMVSSSVQAGAAAQENPTHPIAPDS